VDRDSWSVIRRPAGGRFWAVRDEQKVTHFHRGQNDDLEVDEKILMTTCRSTEKIESYAFQMSAAGI